MDAESKALITGALAELSKVIIASDHRIDDICDLKVSQLIDALAAGAPESATVVRTLLTADPLIAYVWPTIYKIELIKFESDRRRATHS